MFLRANVICVRISGGEELVAKLQEDAVLSGNKSAKEGLADMALLFKYLNIFGVTPKVSHPPPPLVRSLGLVLIFPC